MDSDSKNIAQETFDSMPQDIKEVIFSDDYPRIVAETAKKYNLSLAQESKLEFETTMTLLHLQTRGEYQFSLESELSLDEDTAQQLFNDINDSVFYTVKDSLDSLDAKNVPVAGEQEKTMAYEMRQLESSDMEELPRTDSSLASLADRLKGSSIATPMKGSYGFDIAKNPAPVVETPARAIDPYHESIDNV